ncbi:MAG TPA: tRNA (adenosine(37)-N6)-threonylcarbamoyltransferase complex ATPase subunit type 1 TsaE [Candidatus Angelobacter sp.]|nr:tRNA (adenosine(37)-N6)-threonylcarbamoyltransferase complex ATPase subunit type 1 TsaE [Candidatus Angelobacter sp.]
MLEWTTASSEETMALAEALAKKLNPGTVITLEGDLGAGKTTFTKGLAKGLGVSRVVNSPTFTIIKEYQGTKFPLYHMDVYRLDEDGEEAVAFEDYFYGEGVTVIEWASRVEAWLPSDRLEIYIKRLSEDTRMITLIPHGEKMEDLSEELIV